MKKEMIVNGISFSNEAEYKAALSDSKNIDYISAKVDLTKPKTILKLYNSLITKRTFKTIVGFLFLKQLYDVISTSSETVNEDIPVLDFDEYNVYSSRSNGCKFKNNIFSRKEKEKIKDKTNSQSSGQNDRIEKQQNIIKMLGFTIALLIICIIAMFFITLKSDTVTYNNAKNSVIDEYEQWSEELNERENSIKEKEEELGIK